MTLSRTAFNITTLSIKGLFVTLSINDGITHYIEFHYAECRDLCIVMLSVVMLSVIMVSVVMLNVVMLSVIMLNVFY